VLPLEIIPQPLAVDEGVDLPSSPGPDHPLLAPP
jgi:hypothetical protein